MKLTRQTRNANRHTERGMTALASSIQSDGWIGAITVAADGETFDGSARLDVGGVQLDDAIVVRSDGSRPVVHIREDIPSAEDERAVRLGLAANRIAELNLDFNPAILAAIGADLDLSGLWDRDEWAAIMPREPGAGGDDFDTTPDEGPTRVQPGELWQLGDHRLLCGDSTKAEDVARLMGGDRAAACITDFPYNIGKDYGTWNDNQSDVEFWQRAVPAWLEGIKSALDRPSHFLTSFSERGLVKLIQAAGTAGFDHRHTGVWHNPSRLAGSYPGQWPFGWEAILDFTIGGWVKLRNGNGVGRSDVWIEGSPIGHKSDDDYHPAEKPLAIYVDLIELTTGNADIIYEPFSGSGTTLIACTRTARRCRAIELNPAFCDVILRRFEAETGIAPERVD